MDKTGRTRTHQVLLRLNDEERAMLLRLAERWGLSLSAALRRLIRDEHEHQNPRP
jgi:hypothetical protein